jgi:hypothetical protein
MDDNKDYYLKVNIDVTAPATGGRVGLYLQGGRNVVIIGGTIKIRSQATTGDAADPSVVLVDDGNSAGVVLLEGCDFQSVNGPTLRSKRELRIVNSRIVCKTFQGDHSDAHADIWQSWDRGPGKVVLQGVTGISDYTGLSVLMEPNPTWVKVKDVNVRFEPDHTGPAVYFGDEKNTVWSGMAWFKGGAGEMLDDSLAGFGGDNCAYRITRKSDGAVYVNPESPNPPAGGSSPFGNQQGDVIDYPAVPVLKAMSWTFGDPPGGDFAPANKVGANYVPKGF